MLSVPVGGSGWSRSEVRGAVQVLGPNYRGLYDAEGLFGSSADDSEQRVADNHESYRSGTDSLFCSGVRMIYSETSMIVAFFSYHRGEQWNGDIHRKK